MAFCSGANKAIKKALVDFDKEAEEYLDKALEITKEIKSGLESKTVKALNEVIPSTWDDAAVEWGVNILDKSIQELDIVKGCMVQQTPEERLKCVFNELTKLTGYSQNGWLVKLLSRMIANMDGNKKKESTYDTFAQIGAVSNG